MTQVVAPYSYTLESSIKLTRPDFKTFLQPDTNAGGTSMDQYIKSQHERRLHIPTATGPPDFNLTCCQTNQNKNLSANNHFNSLNTRKPNEISIVDPLTSFLSSTGEILLNTGKTGVRFLGKAKIEPQTTIPQNINSVRKKSEAIDEIRRGIYGQEDPTLKWNTRKVPDAIIRARLGGWTSDYDIRREKTEPNFVRNKLQDAFPNMKSNFPTTESRDTMAKKYQYTSSIQNMYEDVNWDSKLPPKLHAPLTTYEHGKADPLKNNDELYDRPQIWQTVAGKAWDRMQERRNHFSNHPVAFTAPTKRGHQIPGYSGSFGGENVDSMDDVIQNFTPFTVLRTEQPKLPDPNFKPNIPGYTGRTHHFKTTHVSHYDKDGRPFTTYAAYHREIPMIDQNILTNNLSGDFSRITTKVPPGVPHNIIDTTADPNTNHSLDFSSHTTMIAKKRNHQDYVTINKK